MMTIPIDKINVHLSFRKETSFSKNNVPFKAGNTDWQIKLIPCKEYPFDIGQGFAIIWLDKQTNIFYDVDPSFFIINSDGTITINGAIDFVKQAGKYSFMIQQDCNTSYQASYLVVGESACDIDSTLSPTSGDYIADIYEQDNKFYAVNKYGDIVASWESTAPAEQKEYYAALFDTFEINVLQQRKQTDDDLIKLFGLQTKIPMVGDQLPYTIDQSAVDYTTAGRYQVKFTFDYGFDIDCYVNVYNEFTFNEYSLLEYTQQLPNSTNFIDQYPLKLDFSNLKSIDLKGNPAPEIDGPKHEWIGQDVTNVRSIDIIFENVATLENGKTLNVLLNFRPFEIHAKNKEHQRFGFDVDAEGNLKILQNGFTLLGAKLSFFDNEDNVVYLNAALRVDDVHYAKHIGAELGQTEFFVSRNTELLGEEFVLGQTGLSYFIASKYAGDGDIAGSDNIALGIVKQDCSTLSFIFGKEYTGSELFNYALQNPLDMTIKARATQVVALEIPDTTKGFVIKREPASMPLPTTPNSERTVLTIPKSELSKIKSDANYMVFVNGKYTRIGGGANASGIIFTLKQGNAIKITGEITIANDQLVFINFPQLVDNYSFNANEDIVLVARNSSTTIDVTVYDLSLRIQEV